MKKVLLISVCAVVLIMNSSAQNNLKGEQGVSSVGLIGGYAIESDKAVVGVDYRYNVLNKLRLAPSVLYGVKKDYVDTWYLNADVNYLARVSENITLYPIGGLGLSVWTYRKNDKLPIIGIDPLAKTETHVRAGVNIGLGSEVRLTEDIIVGFEFRYNWTERHYNQAMLLMRVAYYF